MERFEAEHLPCDALDKTMVLFNDIVEIFRPPDSDQPTPTTHHEQAVHVEETSCVRSTFVDNNFVWPAVIADGLCEKRCRCGFVTSLGEHEIKGFPRLVDRSVQICPLALNFDIGLIHAPRTACR